MALVVGNVQKQNGVETQGWLAAQSSQLTLALIPS